MWLKKLEVVYLKLLQGIGFYAYLFVKWVFYQISAETKNECEIDFQPCLSHY